MPRTNNHPDYRVSVYKYWIDPVGPPPEEFWKTARQMRSLWNDLCAAWEILQSIPDIEKRKEVSRDLLHNGKGGGLYEYVKSYEMPNSCYWGVFNRFRITIENYFRGLKKGLRREDGKLRYGAPTPHYNLNRISIPYRFNNGGESTSFLFEQRKAVYAKPVGVECYGSNTREFRRKRGSRGYFAIGEAQFPFRIHLHRPLPLNGLIKQFALCAEMRRPFGYRWSLDMTVAEPPPAPKPERSRVAALDLGWRVLEDGLRLGVLCTGAGEVFELALPWDLHNYHTRRLTERLALRGEDWGPIGQFRELWSFETGWAETLETTKAELREQAHLWPTAGPAAQLLQHLTLLRNRGLVKLLSLLKEEGSGQLVDVLERWAERDHRHHRRWAEGVERLHAARKWYYSNIATWIAESFDVLAWEGDLSLRDMAERGKKKGENEFAIENSQKYRQIASLYDLRDRIKKACEKAGREIIGIPSAYTTQTCSRCGGLIEPGASLILECENGHREDQDINAARLMCAHVFSDVRDMQNVPATIDRHEIAKVVRPLSG